jgi:hypothetical protein
LGHFKGEVVFGLFVSYRQSLEQGFRQNPHGDFKTLQIIIWSLSMFSMLTATADVDFVNFSFFK